MGHLVFAWFEIAWNGTIVHLFLKSPKKNETNYPILKMILSKTIGVYLK